MGELSLIVGEGEKICINLDCIKEAAEKSEWVKAMLKYHGAKGEIHLPQTDPVTFKQLLKILCDDKSVVTGGMEDVMDILHQSHMMAFSDCIHKCCEFYSSKVLLNYNFIFNNIAMLDLQNGLDEDSFYLLKWNIKKIFSTKGYLDWGTPTWMRVLQCDNIPLEEIVIFMGVQEWKETNNISLWEVRRLVHLIRFSLMEKADFENIVPASGLLYQDEINEIRKQFGSNNSTPRKRRMELGIHDGIMF